MAEEDGHDGTSTPSIEVPDSIRHEMGLSSGIASEVARWRQAVDVMS